MSFIHLHVHTENSLLEAVNRVDWLVKKAVETGMTSLAITDNGVMFGTIEFYVACKAKGINPIIGCDMYLTKDLTVKERGLNRLVILAKDYQGYQNLIKLVSIAHLEGFYYKPRIDFKHLERYKEGLVIISPGMRGPIAFEIQNHREESAKELAEVYKATFGDDFYLGIQRCGLPFEELIISGSQRLSSTLGIPLVATNDVYYPDEESAYLRNVLSCIQTGKKLEEDLKSFDNSEFYFKTPEQMAALFKDIPEAIENTVKIAEKCHVNLEMDQVYLPNFECPDGLSSEAYLKKLVQEGLIKKYKTITPEIQARMEFELAIINKMHYANYFLIIHDFLAFCERMDIPVGPGRGSAAGAIVAYALNITKVDPLAYNLLFERFLNPERVSMPDVDIDFCIKRRGEVIQYIVQKYGQECVSQIITFGTMQARAVIRDVGRVLDVPLWEVDRIAKLIPATPGSYTSIPEALEEVPDLAKEYKSNPSIRRLLDIGAALEGQARHSSTHAAGVVISKNPLTTVVPLTSNGGQISTQFAMADIEKIGLLKMDILGLRNLTVMQDAVEKIKSIYGINFNLDHLDINDKKSYDLLCEGKTVGVFQLESRGMRQLIKDLKPTVFEDIIALLALYRPGPLGSGMVSDFISNKSGKTQVKYDLPILEPILKDTYGMIVYQEQVMQIASAVGGFTLGQADMLRRAMGKKKKDVMDQMKAEFISGAEKKKFPVKISEKIFELCYKFAEYGFNKSHSAAYALISYQTAYLKANYPVEYMASLLSSVLSTTDKTVLYIQECRDMGIKVEPPCVQESLSDMTVSRKQHAETGEETKSIRFGLGAIKNVGEGAIESIILERTKGPFKDLGDFCVRVDLRQVNKRVIESLIKAGAMDSLGPRGQSMKIYERVLERAQIAVKEQSNGQVGLFGDGGATQTMHLADLLAEPFEILSIQDRLRMEKEMMGLYISGHPLDAYRAELENIPHRSDCLGEEFNGKEVHVAGLLTECRKIITKTKREMGIGLLEDEAGVMTVLLFQGPGFETWLQAFKDDTIVTAKGKFKINGDEKSIAISELSPLGQQSKSQHLMIDIEGIHEIVVLEKIKALAEEFRGPLPLYFKIGETTIQANKKYGVTDDPELQIQLEALVGSGRIWLKEDVVKKGA